MGDGAGGLKEYNFVIIRYYSTKRVSQVYVCTLVGYPNNIIYV